MKDHEWDAKWRRGEKERLVKELEETLRRLGFLMSVDGEDELYYRGTYMDIDLWRGRDDWGWKRFKMEGSVTTCAKSETVIIAPSKDSD